MRKWWLCLLLPLGVAASSPPPYAKRWPVILSGVGDAYRVVLTPEVYQTVAWSDLRDVDVLDANGQPVAAALLAPEARIAEPVRQLAVPWFPLPAQTADNDLPARMSAQFGEHGKILRIDVQTGSTSGAIANVHLPSAGGFLVDLSSIRSGVEKLEILWQPGSPHTTTFQVESSDDLRQWRVEQDRVELMELQRGDAHLVLQVPQSGRETHGETRLLANTVTLRDPYARYLRLLPLDAVKALPIQSVRAHLKPNSLQAPRSEQELAGQRVEEKGETGFVYSSDGRYPVSAVELVSADAAVGEWILESRESDKAAWQYRAGPWLAYQVRGARAKAQELSGAPVRDRFWRLRSQGALPAQSPRLRLLYQQEVVMFLAQGKPPYALVAGSGSAHRVDAPMPQLVRALQAQRGEDWRPAPAYLAASQVLAGAAAKQVPRPPRDGKAWLLWAALVTGAVLVVWMALSLLRKPHARV